MNWDSIDFENKTLTIRRKVTSQNLKGTGETIRIDSELKTASSVRTFPLIPHIEKMLRDKKYQEEYYSNLIGDSFDKTYDGFVCRDNMGKLITPAYVTTHFKLMVDSNGLKHLRFHDLRHSCASLLVASGVPMKAVQEWLGHATYNITADYYSHLDFRSKMASADTISKLLDGSNQNGDTSVTISPLPNQSTITSALRFQAVQGKKSVSGFSSPLRFGRSQAMVNLQRRFSPMVLISGSAVILPATKNLFNIGFTFLSWYRVSVVLLLYLTLHLMSSIIFCILESL